MGFVKDEEYKTSKKTWIDYFENNFKQSTEGSHPANYEYDAKQVPNSYFTAVDVFGKNKQFLARYLIVVVRNGDTSKNTPDTYQEYLDDDLSNLSSPIPGVQISKGIAVLFIDDDNNFKDMLIEHDLRISSS